MLGLQLAFVAGTDRRVTIRFNRRLDAHAVAQSLHTRTPSGYALGFLRDASESKLFLSSVVDGGCKPGWLCHSSLSLSLSASRALATRFKKLSPS